MERPGEAVKKIFGNKNTLELTKEHLVLDAYEAVLLKVEDK